MASCLPFANDTYVDIHNSLEWRRVEGYDGEIHERARGQRLRTNAHRFGRRVCERLKSNSLSSALKTPSPAGDVESSETYKKLPLRLNRSGSSADIMVLWQADLDLSFCAPVNSPVTPLRSNRVQSVVQRLLTVVAPLITSSVGRNRLRPTAKQDCVRYCRAVIPSKMPLRPYVIVWLLLFDHP